MSGDGSIEALHSHVEALGAALGRWAERDVARPQPAVRRAGDEAMAAIDAAMADLRRLRDRLAAEIRESDQVGAARVDTFLAALVRDWRGAR